MSFLRKPGPLLVIGFLLGCGSWLVIWSWQQVRTHQQLDQGAAVVEGQVIESASRELSKGGQSWTLRVEYAPDGRDAITKEFDVDGGTYRDAVASGRASVSYLPENPEIARVTRFAALPFQLLIGLGGLMLAGGLFAFVHAVQMRDMATSPPESVPEN